MSEIETQEPASETPTETVEEEQPETPDLSAEVEKWKALARKNEARAKENSEKAKRHDELEEANRTELEKAIARAEKAEKLIAENEAKEEQAKLRKEVAKEYGVEEAALRGTSREDLEEHASILKEYFKTSKGSTTDGQGKVGEPISGEKQITSRDELNNMSPQQIEEARKAGRLDSLMGNS